MHRTAYPTPVPGQQALSIVHTVFSLGFGGLEQFAVRLAAAQRSRGHRVAILAFHGGPLVETARAAGVDVCLLRELGPGLGKIGAIPRFLQAMAVVARRRPNIIHAHNPTSLHYDAAAKLLTAAKLVLTDHGQCAGIERVPKNWELGHTDVLVSVSRDVDERHRDIFRPVKQRQVIYNGTNFPAPQHTRQEMRKELGLNEELVGVVVARLDPVKDHDTLLEALSLLQRPRHAVTLIVVGDGSERQRLEARLPSLGLTAQQVRFVGFRSDVPDLLAAADFFVLSSLQEGLPLAMLEAMAHGLPVVATSVGGVPELITQGDHGLLVPIRQPLLLADAIRKIIDEPAWRHRMGETAAAHVQASFSFDEMVVRYEELYRTAISTNR